MKDKFDLVHLNDCRVYMINQIEQGTSGNKSFSLKILKRIEDLMINASAHYVIENNQLHPDVSKIKNWKKPLGSRASGNKTLEERKFLFMKEVNLIAFETGISDASCKDFINYWTETNKSETKMKFEMRETFQINRRLKYWNNNDSSSSKTKKASWSSQFKKTKTGLYLAYCSRCGNRQMPNDKWQLQDGSSCCRVEYLPSKKQ